MPEMKTAEEIKLLNQAFCDKITSDDPGMQKQALDAVIDFTRIRIRETGFYRQVVPMLPITADQLTRRSDSPKPAIVIDREPEGPPAITIGFGTLPQNLYIRADRYWVMFDRITTDRFTADVADLMTWHMDIRQVISDNAIKDMQTEEDTKFLAAVDYALVGPGSAIASSGVAQYEQISGGITRDSWHDSLKILPSTRFHLSAHTILLNNITVLDLCKFDRIEAGGNMAEDVLKQGWTLTELSGRKLVVTIKHELVPTGTMYHFADPKFIGKSYSLQDVTMYVKREAYFLEFFAYETIGGAIGHTGGIARVDFE